MTKTSTVTTQITTVTTEDTAPPTVGNVTAVVLDAAQGKVRVDVEVDDALSGVDQVGVSLRSPGDITLGDRPIGPSSSPATSRPTTRAASATRRS